MLNQTIIIFLSQKKGYCEKVRAPAAVYLPGCCPRGDRNPIGLQKVNCHLLEVEQEGVSRLLLGLEIRSYCASPVMCSPSWLCPQGAVLAAPTARLEWKIWVPVVYSNVGFLCSYLLSNKGMDGLPGMAKQNHVEYLWSVTKYIINFGACEDRPQHQGPVCHTLVGRRWRKLKKYIT